MDIFGNVRNKYNRLEDFGYGFSATGERTEAQVQADIDALADEIAQAYTAYDNAIRARDHAELNVRASASYMYGTNQLCKSTDTRKKCNEKRDKYNREKYLPYVATLNTKKAEVTTASNRINTLKAQMTQLTEELETILFEREKTAEASQTLAQQGQTAESIRIEAKAEADARAQQAQVQAQERERKSKSKKVIILSIVFAGLLIGGFWAFMAIRKKSK
jgi:hypothetical protein